MRTEQYIEELLYRYNCVVIPEFGAFLTQKKSAELDKATNTFTPPTKIVSFNQQVKSNDGLLITYIATAEKSTYEVALEALTKEVEHWKRMLKLGQRIKFASVGELFLNEDEKIQFIPANQVNYLTTSFGLSTVVASPITREVLKEEVVALEEEVPFIITPEKRKTSAFRPYLKYAAIALLAVSTGLTGLRYYNTTVAMQEVAQQDANEQISRSIQEATFFDATPLELPSLSLDIIAKPASQEHYVIAGAFRVQKNANRKIEELKEQGYNALYVGVNKYGLHQVAYASFSDANEGINYLNKIKSSVSSDAWLLSVK
ncbi:MAG: SPOR domain-containing protein [Cellulophaga sp.]|uniref:HU domain-containing protein n=1 Tax=unclassified Cellulophaga TaxID=2634405 RepID=UPI0026E1B26B|nr:MULTISPECIES: SPOR domain-containing protein [unclassified Cellulophaga]MDO6489826.1 SPOR domain-containing protein [Cellulophaga sp. 2_MG-2023]MDO6494980.1 SPOR domain-containing protein [Cellulophaga sp. 3_MG-2023]